jgi:hypothetical protein
MLFVLPPLVKVMWACKTWSFIHDDLFKSPIFLLQLLTAEFLTASVFSCQTFEPLEWELVRLDSFLVLKRLFPGWGFAVDIIACFGHFVPCLALLVALDQLSPRHAMVYPSPHPSLLLLYRSLAKLALANNKLLH